MIRIAMAYMNMDEHGHEIGPSCPCEQAGKYVPSCDAHPDLIFLRCLNCGEYNGYPSESSVATGVLNAFCEGGECEDRYAAKL